jgi:hypothetical protein
LPQVTLNLGIIEAYTKTKEVLVKEGCAVIFEEQNRQLVVKQGSLWGISPKTAKKTITATFKVAGDKTDVAYNSEVASDWKYVTIIGCVLAAALIGLCVWMALDLSEFMTTGGPGFWSWLITSGDTVRFSAGEAFVNLTWGLSVFLAIIIAIETAIYVQVNRKIELSAEAAFAQVA